MKNKLAIIVPLLILAVGIAIAYQMIKKDRQLPIYAPSQINPELVDESKQKQTKGHRIAAFELIDENGDSFTSEQLKDYYYVVDFFFTTCPTICPDMSSNMQKVQEAYKDDEDFRILSFTVQPEIDSADILREYADRYQAMDNKWTFLTGDKKVIYDLARKSYFTSVTEGNGGPNDFIHTENFVLVDKNQRIRGFYDGTSGKAVEQLITDIEILAQEYD